MDFFSPMPFKKVKTFAQLIENGGLTIMAKVFNDSASTTKIMANLLPHEQDKTAMLAVAGSFEDIGKWLGRGANVKDNIYVFYGAYSAWTDLDPSKVRSNPQKAAKQFGKLFSSVGELSAYLPSPFNSYAAFIGGFGDFFEDIRDKMDPESPNTPRGRSMNRSNKSTDRFSYGIGDPQFEKDKKSLSPRGRY
jgi:hypothetical protein